jgi:hypothetical protein
LRIEPPNEACNRRERDGQGLRRRKKTEVSVLFYPYFTAH